MACKFWFHHNIVSTRVSRLINRPSYMGQFSSVMKWLFMFFRKTTKEEIVNKLFPGKTFRKKFEIFVVFRD